MDQRINDAGICTSCGEPVVESSNLWHGYEVCDSCLAGLHGAIKFPTRSHR